jgi:hypothetical protein
MDSKAKRRGLALELEFALKIILSAKFAELTSIALSIIEKRG